MCTKYSLQDNPDIFKQFIPRNLSYTELSDSSFESKFAWCLMSDDQTKCQCKFPTLYKFQYYRKGRKDLFDERIGRVIPNSLKEANCWMCKGSLSYFPNDVSFVDVNYGRSKSQINGNSIKIRKSVRFADALGLQLSQIKFINEWNSEKAPNLSSSAIKDLHLDHNYHLAMQGIKYFSPCFKITTDETVLHDTTMEKNICLEKAYIEGMDLFGRILVKNLSYEKNVGIRITFNQWSSFKDIYASYILESSDGMVDKFSFSIAIPHFVIVHSKIEFSVFYMTQDGTIFWDNNDKENYSFECFAKNMGIVTDDGWLHFL